MTYLALVFVVVAGLYIQKLIRDGKIPRPNDPKGLPTKVALLLLLAATVYILYFLNFAGGPNLSSLVPTLAGLGVGIWALIRAKHRQDRRKAGIEDKGEMKRSLIFLGFAILVAIVLVILSI